MGRQKRVSDEAALGHARAVFLAQGAAASTKDIARAAGLSEAALFQRFRTKRELMIAALSPGQVDAHAILLRAPVPDDPRQALLEFGRRMRGYFRDQIPCGLLLMTSGVRAEEFMGPADQAPLVAFSQVLERYLSAASARHAILAPDPFAAAGLFVAAIHSLVIFELGGGHGTDPDDHALTAFADALWHGLAPDHPR